jgi:fatty-acyl-CoA synthase
MPAVAAGPTLHDVLRHNAVHFADKAALRLDDRAITFRELARRVDDQARVLARHVAPGDRVALWFHNSFQWLASFLALDALGVVSVPVNTRLTPVEVEAILGDVRPRALVTAREYRNRRYLDEALEIADRLDWGLSVLDASDEGPADAWPVRPARRAPPPPAAPVDDLLCIQYTSGTTALPKGAMLTRRAYLRTAEYVARCQRLTPSTSFISGAPFFHCSGTMHAITTCLVAGCTLNALSAWDAERFVDQTAKHRCDVSHMIYYRDVLALGADRARPRLATMKVTHDLGTRDYLARIHDELGIPGVSNLYGMTETCGQFTMWFPDDPLERRLGANGRPRAGKRVRIVDPHSGEALPPGRSGEIQMRGSTLTAGYFDRPDATAAAFTPDGWFRSGDLGTTTPDGELVYLARLKEIIRVGGENLAPAEVEQVLRDVCGVQQVCVLGLPDPRLEEVPAAVVVGAERVDWNAALSRMRARLAGFKMPRAVYTADELPITATNRVQRAVLRDWIAAGRLTRVA